jgi:hypothetical protein
MCGEEQQFFFGMSLLFRLEFRYMWIFYVMLSRWN